MPKEKKVATEKVVLVFEEVRNNIPIIYLRQLDFDLIFYPEFGYDLCDFASLKRQDGMLMKLYQGNYYKSNERNHHKPIYYSLDSPVKKIIKRNPITHPYFYFDLYDDILDEHIPKHEDESSNFETMPSVIIAQWEASQFFDLVETEELSMEFFHEFISNTHILPNFSFSEGASPKRNIEDYYRGEKDYNQSLEDRKRIIQSKLNQSSTNPTTYYYCRNLIDVVMVYIYHTLKLGYTFKKCKNCGKWFIPYHRSDTLYCDRFAPDDKTKTCKEYGAQQTYLENLDKDEGKKLYRKIYQRLKMRINRNPDIDFHSKNLEKFKSITNQLKNDIKKGKASNEEYKEWLLDFYDRNFERRNPNG